MEKVRYYYSQPMCEANIIALSDHCGNFDPLNIIGISKSSIKILPRLTICSILDMDTWNMSFGVARCNPSDNFCRKIGRKVAYKNATEKPIIVAKAPQNNIGVWRVKICQEIEQQMHRINYDRDSF